MTFCLLGENCSVFDRARKIAGIARGNPLCEGCRMRAGSELNLLRYDYVDLSQLVPRRDGHSEAKISRPKPESVPPVDVAVFTLRGHIASTVHMAEKWLRMWLGAKPRVALPVREGFSLDSAIRYLSPRVDELATMGEALDYWDATETVRVALSGPDVLVRIGMLHRAARRMCGLDPRSITVPGDCPRCRAPSLRRHDDDPEKIWCVHCRLRMSKLDYQAAMRMQFAPVTTDETPR